MTGESDADVSRRRFLRGAAGAGAGTAAVASGSVAAQEGDGDGEGEDGGEQRPDWGGWLTDIDGGYEDLRGNEEVTVSVGAEGNGGDYAFSPAGIWIDQGTTVTWEWTGDGGGHNVVEREGDFGLDSGNPVSEPGVHYESTFEEGGISQYVCVPHESLGMLGAIAVGDEVSTVSVGGDGGGGGGVGTRLPDGAKALGVASAGALASTLALAYLFIKYGGSSRPVEE